MAGQELIKIKPQAVPTGETLGEPQFLHSVLCQLGLPRAPTPLRTFERTSGQASLLLQAGKVFDGKKWIEQPLPSGTRPRLALMNICSEAVRCKSPEVDIGDSMREFLRRLRIDASGGSMRRFRKEMVALSVCHMSLGVPTAMGGETIDAKPVERFEAWVSTAEGQRALWPGRLRLTDKFFESLVEHAVPLDCEAIAQLQNSALALDVYTWMTHRLPRVRDASGVVLPWGTLQDQFGQEYRQKNNFKRDFLGAVRRARDVYKDARIEEQAGGLRLLPSPPSVRRPSVRVAAVAEAPKRAASAEAGVPKSVERNAPVGKAAKRPWGGYSVTDEALERARGDAPRWDMHGLRQMFLDWANKLPEPLTLATDDAFVRWVPKITNRKPPP